MKYLNRLAIIGALFALFSLPTLVFAETPYLEGLGGGLNSTTLCSLTPATQGIAVATFEQEAECNSYVGALVLGATMGYSYSNCSSSSYCMTFDNTLVGGFAGFNLVAFAANCIYDAALEFASNETCADALAASDIICRTDGGPGPVCVGSVLQITHCGSGGGIGSFTTLLNTLSSFSLIYGGC